MARSSVVWGLWLAVFLALELPAAFGVVPWTTFSEWSERLEALNWVAHALIFGFGIGLVIHIAFRAPFGRALVLGAAVALLAHFVNNRWP